MCIRDSYGGDQSLATKTDGTLWTWGNSIKGSHGQNLPDNYDFSSPKQVGGTDWKTGKESFWSGITMFAIKTDGTMYSWGSNEQGCLGQNEAQPAGYLTNRSSPTQLTSATNWKAVSFRKNYVHVMEVNTTVELFNWGRNSNGQLGLNEATPVQRSSPTQVPGTTWDKIRATSKLSSAIKTDGTLWLSLIHI